jgi:hypothetical protein
MSTVVLDTITGKSTATTITIGSTPVISASANSMTIRGEGSNQTSIQQGLAKMFVSWVYDSSTPTSTDSLNVSGILDTGTGDADVNLSVAMSSSRSYSLVVTGNHNVTGNPVGDRTTASQVAYRNFDDSGGASDGAGDNNSMLIHGDLT